MLSVMPENLGAEANGKATGTTNRKSAPTYEETLRFPMDEPNRRTDAPHCHPERSRGTLRPLMPTTPRQGILTKT